MTAAQWSVAVPSRHVDGSGSAVVQVVCTDAVSGDVYTTTVTLTAGRVLTALVDGSQAAVPLAGYEAWSTT